MEFEPIRVTAIFKFVWCKVPRGGVVQEMVNAVSSVVKCSVYIVGLAYITDSCSENAGCEMCASGGDVSMVVADGGCNKPPSVVDVLLIIVFVYTF